jgi:hypothetical protein
MDFRFLVYKSLIMKNTPLLLLFSFIFLASCATHKMTRFSKLKPQELKAGTNYVIPFDATVKGNFVRVDAHGNMKMISEVSPDAIVTATTNVTNKITANLAKGQKFTAEQATAITQAVTELGKRTVAVNILRDALFRLEEFKLNRDTAAMDTSTYNLFAKIIECATTIAKAEFEGEKAKQDQAKAANAVENTKQIALEVQKDASIDKVAIAAVEKTKYQLAGELEQQGILAIIDNKIEVAKAAFENAYKLAPTYHNVFEIRNLLNAEKDNKIIINKILSDYKWGLPIEIIQKLDNNK